MSNHKPEPAFPHSRLGSDADGMGLRDYFAAKALPGLMGRNWSFHKGTDEELMEIWARASYFLADAMLAAREKGGAK